MKLFFNKTLFEFVCFFCSSTNFFLRRSMKLDYTIVHDFEIQAARDSTISRDDFFCRPLTAFYYPIAITCLLFVQVSLLERHMVKNRATMGPYSFAKPLSTCTNLFYGLLNYVYTLVFILVMGIPCKAI